MRWRTATGFANADADSRKRQLQHIRRHAGQRGHTAPDRQGNGNQIATIEAIRQKRDRHTERCIENCKRRACKETEHPVVDHEFRFDGRQ